MFKSIHKIFNHRESRKFLLLLRKPLALVIFVLVVMIADKSWFWPGLIISVIGGLCQLWCFSCINTSKTLALNGPYRLARNPMYLSRFLLILGVVMFTGNLWAIGIYTVLYYFYMVNRVKREERKLEKIFGEYP